MPKKKQYIAEKDLEPEDLAEENRPGFPPTPLKEIKFTVEVKVKLKVVKPERYKGKTRT